jgi:DUF4097 and DUF4098 domain-containing protein YvlB
MIRLRSCLLVTLGLTAAASICAELRVEKTLKLDPGGRLSVDTELGAVTVTGSGDPDVRVIVTSTERDLEELLTLRFEEAPRSVRVIGRRKHRLFDWSGHRVHFEIQVPTETALDIDTSGGAISVAAIRSNARLRTSGGSINVRDFAGDLDGSTSGGSVRLARIQGRITAETSGGSIDGSDLEGPVDVSTSGGEISLKRVTGNLKAHTSGGSIEIQEAGGRVDADTSGGGIEASFARGNAQGGSLESSGGGIEVSMDSDVNLTIDASGDSVKTDLPIQVSGQISRGKLRGSLGKGGETLRLQTSGGSVHIRSI